MIIALAQMNVRPGRAGENYKNMIKMIQEARKKGAQLVVFPEMCVGGYMLGDLWLEEDWIKDLEEYNQLLAQEAHGIALVWGNVKVLENQRGFDGRKVKYNAAFFARDGQLFWEAKTLLPNYRIFDDRRYFTPRSPGERKLFSLQGKSFGLTVCEDMWSNDYPSDPVIELIEKGAQFILNISASPWTYGKNLSRDRQITLLEEKAQKWVPFFYVNNVGVQNNGKNIITFDGDSAVYAQGHRLHSYDLEPFEEGLILIDDEHLLSGGERGLPGKIHQKHQAILQGIRGFDESLGSWKPPYIIGLSGGVDSALVAALMVQALGAKRILAFNLPSRYNSGETKGAAKKVAENLGISLTSIPIEVLVGAHHEALKEGGGQWSSLVEENIQAKIRGTSLLSNLAALHGGIMTNNGNKLELALGYATLYGDMNGALSPIGDLTKEEVFQMCSFLNEKTPIIPGEMLPDDHYAFSIPPSAELKENQRDPIKFGYHDALLEQIMDYQKKSPATILGWYREGKKVFCEKLRMKEFFWDFYDLGDPQGFITDLEWFLSAFSKAIFKRIQSPPIILLSKTAFGYDLRESQIPWVPTRAYLRMKEAVLLEKGGNR